MRSRISTVLAAIHVAYATGAGVTKKPPSPQLPACDMYSWSSDSLLMQAIHAPIMSGGGDGFDHRHSSFIVLRLLRATLVAPNPHLEL